MTNRAKVFTIKGGAWYTLNMNLYGRRLFNFRPLVLVAITLMAGIALGALVVLNSVAAPIICGVGVVLVVALSCIKKVREVLSVRKIAVLFGIVFFVFGFLYVFLAALKVDSRSPKQFNITSATGVVCDVKTKYIEVTRVSADYLDLDTGRAVTDDDLKGNIRIYVSTAGKFHIGDEVVFRGRFKYYSSSYKGALSSLPFVAGVSGSCFLDSEEISVFNTGVKVDLFDFIRKHAHEMFTTNMRGDAGEIAYSMLFGDKGAVEDIYDDFKVSGIAHLLAVSGLHVGFMALILAGLAKLMKLNDKWRFGFITTLLFIYVWICNFNPSALRAFIMVTVMTASTFRGKQYDKLNSLALACIIVLTIQPFQLFMVGFQLSFASVLSIILLAPVLQRAMEPKLGNKLAGTLAVTLSVEIGTFFIIAKISDRMSGLSVLANLLAIPVATVAYMSAVIILMVATIFPSLSVAFIVPEFAFNLVILIAKTVANLKALIFNVWFIDLCMYIVLIASVVASDYFFGRKPYKNLAGMLIAIVILIGLGFV